MIWKYGDFCKGGVSTSFFKESYISAMKVRDVSRMVENNFWDPPRLVWIIFDVVGSLKFDFPTLSSEIFCVKMAIFGVFKAFQPIFTEKRQK